MEKYSISSASVFDLAAVYRLEKVCFGDDAWSWPDVFSSLIWPGELRLRATEDGRLIAFAMGEPNWRYGISMVTTIGVDPRCRRRGVGSAILAACEARLPGRRIRLTVREDNAEAIRLYERFGYRRISRLPAYYRDGEAGILMEKVKPDGEGKP